MKVLFDYQTLIAQKYGGVSRYHCEIKKELDKIYGVSVDVPVLFSQNAYFEHEYGIKAVKEYPPKTKRLVKILNHWNTYLKCKLNKYDIIHPTWYDPYLLGHIGSAKLVITIHDMIYEIYPERFSSNAIENRKRYIFAADKIIAVSQNTKQDILTFYPEIVPDKISVIYESATLASKSKEVKGIPSRYILFVGARKGYKNFEKFYQAIVPLLRREKDLYLVCIGGGAFDQKENLMINASGVAKKVQQHWLTDEELNTVYQRALCFVYPSLYEGFGLPILEAMGNSCPCAVSRASSFPEVAGEAAIYFDPENKQDIYQTVNRLVEDTLLREHLRDLGIIQYTKFSWEKTAQEMYEEYCKLVENK